jgi:hypothetical protein
MHIIACVFCRRFNRQNKILTRGAAHAHDHASATLSTQEKQAMANRLRGL